MREQTRPARQPLAVEGLPESGDTKSQLLAAFCMMEQQGRGGESNFSRLFPYLEHPDFLIRCKAFLTLGRTGNADDGGPLLELLERPWLPWAHLMVLDAYHGLPIPGPQRAAALAQVDSARLHPTVRRGFLWVLAHTEEPLAFQAFAEFLQTYASWSIKDEFLNELWFGMAAALPEEAVRLTAASPKLRVWLRHRIRAPKSHFGLYPAPDYLWQIAKKQGVEQADFRRIFYYPRQKHGGKQWRKSHIS